MALAPDFAGAVAALVGRPLAADEPLALAVSGGPDSLGMLVLAADAGLAVHVLTVDHGLRADAAAEAAYVAGVCRDRGAAHHVLGVDVERAGEGVQAAARRARYAAMGAWCDTAGVRWLLTAHHADDQAETLLMRLARGSGLAGMAGIRARRPLDGSRADLLRPLLGVRKIDLVAIVEGAGLRLIEDPSNDEPSYDRTAARRLLLGGGIDSARAAETAAHLADAEAALDWTAREAWAGRAVAEAESVELDTRGLPAEIVRRLVLRAVSGIDETARPDGPAIMRLVRQLESGRRGSCGVVVAESGRTWRFSPAPPRLAAKPRQLEE